MNRCEEVLKKNRNNGLKIEKDELYHSDLYLGSEYDEGLKHWKYIDRYRNTKGKWVYVYANKKTHGAIQKAGGSVKGIDDVGRQQYGSNTGRVLTKKQDDKLNAYWNQYEDMLQRNKIGKGLEKATKFIKGTLKEAAHAKVTDFIRGTLNEANYVLGRVFKNR